MGLKVFFSGAKPGYGTLAIHGAELPSAELLIAIQRNLDDQYLGPNQSWHSTPYWHLPERVESMEKILQLHIGPEIVDGLVTAAHMPLLLWVRAGGIEQQGVMRIKGPLLGSHAASDDTVELGFEDQVAEIRPAPHAREDENHVLERQHLQREAEERGLAAETWSRRQRRARRWRLLALPPLIALLIAGGVAVWHMRWLDEIWPTSNEPPKTETSRGQPPLKQTSLQGRKFVQYYLQRDPKPTPRALYAAAQEREKARDCEGAMILYNFAADADNGLAMALAERYDPDTFRASPCVKSPAADSASHWYENPAKAGNAAAQRQLGKLLISRQSSGPVYDQGMRWLQQAAKAGDREAQKLMTEMGEE